MTPKDPIDALDEAATKHGSVSAFARATGFAPSYVHDVISGRRPPSKKLLDALGLKRVVVQP